MSATRVMRSTAAWRSSSEIRVNSPPITMSLTVSRQPAWTLRRAPSVKMTAASISTREHAAGRPALVAALVRVVEGVRRGDRADAHRLLELLRRVDGAVDELPVGGRAVRLLADVVPRGAVGGDRGQRDDQVAELEVGLEPAAGADAQEALDAELDELLHHDRRGRAAHAGRLHRDRLALVLARVAEQPALGVPLHRVVEVGLGDVLRAQRVAGQQAGLCVVAWLGSDVNRHGRSLLRRFRPVLIEPTVEQILAFCAEDPIERVFLEDVARRGFARFRARRGRRAGSRRSATSARTSSRRDAAAGRSPATPRRAAARMIIGERARGHRPLGAAPVRHAQAARGPAGPARLRHRGAARSPARPACARRRSTTSSCSSRPARRRTSRSSASTRSSATRTASAGARSRRSRRGARGSGSRTGRSSSRRRRRPGRRSAVQLQQVWVDPAARRQGYATARAQPTSAGCCSSGRPTVCLFVRPENEAAIRLYETIGMRRVGAYRSVLF